MDGKQVNSGQVLWYRFLETLEVLGTKILMGGDVPTSLPIILIVNIHL